MIEQFRSDGRPREDDGARRIEREGYVRACRDTEEAEAAENLRQVRLKGHHVRGVVAKEQVVVRPAAQGVITPLTECEILTGSALQHVVIGGNKVDQQGIGIPGARIRIQSLASVGVERPGEYD